MYSVQVSQSDWSLAVYMYLLGCQFQLVPTIYHNFTTHQLVKVWPIKIETILTCPCFAGLLLAPHWRVEQALCVVYDQRTENSWWKKFLPFAEKCTVVWHTMMLWQRWQECFRLSIPSVHVLLCSMYNIHTVCELAHCDAVWLLAPLVREDFTCELLMDSFAAFGKIVSAKVMLEHITRNGRGVLALSASRLWRLLPWL